MESEPSSTQRQTEPGRALWSEALADRKQKPETVENTGWGEGWSPVSLGDTPRRGNAALAVNRQTVAIWLWSIWTSNAAPR